MKLTVAIESNEVDEFVKELTKSSDIFRRDHCGYWLVGIECHILRGWLAFDGESGCQRDDEMAIVRWNLNKSLPQGYYRLDYEFAIKAWIEGAKKYGVEWFGTLGSNARDFAVQMAMFGEVVYG